MPFLLTLAMLLAQDEHKVEEVHGYLQYVPCTTVQCSIQRASQTYGVSHSRLTCLAFRESTNNPYATNGPYVGLMQFDASTWQLTPYRNLSRTDHEASAMAAAYLIARGESGRWPVYRFC